MDIHGIQPKNFTIEYDSQEYISRTSEIDDVIKIETQSIENEITKLHVAYIEIGIEMDENLAYNFELELTDINGGAPLEGAEYNIEIVAGNFTRKITKRPTNANGKISTRLAMDVSLVNEISIIVQQQSAKKGYKVDDTIQEITAILNTNTVAHNPAAVTQPDNPDNSQIRYAELKLNDKTIIYHHTNRAKELKDNKLNIHITTIDAVTGATIGGIPVNITNIPVTGTNGEIIQITDENKQQLNINKITDTAQLTIGKAQFENLNVEGINILEEEEYEVRIVVDGKLIRVKLVYRFDENLDRVVLQNAETVIGMEMIKKKTFSSHETNKEYTSDVNLMVEIPAKKTANLTLDLKKADLETKDPLYEALYDIIIERPDGTKIIEKDVEILNGDDDIELSGVYVPINSKIYITETKAPIGYETNNTIELEVTGINAITNEVTLEKKNDNYSISRSTLTQKGTIQYGPDSIRTQYVLDMYDVQTDKFDFKIKTINNTTLDPVSGFSFEISNDVGAQKLSSTTNSNGEVITRVGGVYSLLKRTYTITGVTSGTYYKKLVDPIVVDVYFNDDGTVNEELTRSLQTDKGFLPTSSSMGTWSFEEINKLDEEGNLVYHLGIVIKVEVLDPLIVEIETVNKFTGDKVSPISDFNYTITPSVEEARGSESVSVKYAELGTQRIYKIEQTVPNNYIAAENLNLQVFYDENGDISIAPGTTSENLTVVSYNGKTVKIRVEVEPKATIAFKNVYFFDTTQNIQGSEFVVTKEGVNAQITTDSNGQGMGYIGAFGEGTSTQDEEVVYKVTQTTVPLGYAKIDPFEIIVKYNSNREITDVKLKETNKLVTVSYTQPSTVNDYGYNYSDKGIVNIRIESYPSIRFNVTNVDRQNSNKYLAGTNYEVLEVKETETVKTSGNTTTNSNGKGTAHVDESKFNKTVTFVLRETAPSVGYQTFGPDIYVEIDFDADGYVNQDIENNPRIINNPSISKIAATSKANIVDMEDYFTIEVETKNNPLVKFNITKLDKVDKVTPLSSVQFEVTGVLDGQENSKDDKAITNENGEATAIVYKSIDNKTVEYTIKETKRSPLYQSLPQDIKLQVTYDDNGKLISIQNCRVTQGMGYIDIINVDPDNFTVDMKIYNNPLLYFNITKVDAINGALLGNVKFEVTGILDGNENSKDEDVLTDAQGRASAKIYQTVENKTIEYTIKETETAGGYQNLPNDIKLQISYDGEGKIATNSNGEAQVKIMQGAEYIVIDNIDIEHFAIDMTIKNNPLLRFNITKLNKANHDIPIRGVTLNITGEHINQDVTTNAQGQAIATVQKTVANKTIEYTIKETKKSPLYEWLPTDITLQISYDKDGKIIEPDVRITKGNEYIEITNISTDNFTIDMEIYNDEIEEFGVYICTDDVYDGDKRVEKATWKAYLTRRDEDTGRNYLEDTNYTTTLVSGRTDENGQRVYGYGEDYQVLGKYTGGAGTRTLRLQNQGMPNTYYKDGKQHNSSYSLGASDILIDIDFDSDGKIINEPRLITGDNFWLGWVLDGRYVTIQRAGDYGITVNIHYYPLLEISLKTQDMYTDSYLQASYTISTKYGDFDNSNGVSAGYIGHAYNGIPHTSIGYTSNTSNQPANSTFTRVEGGSVREIYLYENSEPGQYQKYGPRITQNSTMDSRKIAKIAVYYDNLGEVRDVQVLETYSKNNINSGFVTAQVNGIYKDINDNNPHDICINVDYAPRTIAQIKVQDPASGARISGLTIEPFKQNSYCTKDQYRDNIYTIKDNIYKTNTSGEVGWEYWGANIAGETRTYQIKVQDIPNGYFGSTEESFKTILVEVEFNNDGRIGRAKVINQNAFGEPVASIDTSCYGTNQLKLEYNLSRKVGLKINKIGYANEKLSARFKVTHHQSTIGNEYEINTGSSSQQLIGKMYGGKVVEYTIQEISTPDGYLPLTNDLKLIVEYKQDGTIANAYPGDTYSEKYLNVNYISKDARGVNKELYRDIEISIINERAFFVELDLADKFYNNIKLDDVTFDIESDKGEKGFGTLVTNSNGKIITTVGKIYPNETVKYTITQQSKANEYYKLAQPIEFTVSFDELGHATNTPILLDNYSKEYARVQNASVEEIASSRTAKIMVFNMPEKVYLGINKSDKVTNDKLANVEFKVTVEENGTTRTINNILTNENGNIVVELDAFKNTGTERVVKYKVEEINQLDGYRKVQPYEIEVKYDEKGGINTWQVINKDTKIDHSIYRRGNTNISKVENTYTHINLNIVNDNGYDLIIKNEDKNCAGLGIEGTRYEVLVSGDAKQAELTSKEGITRVSNLNNAGNVEIQITEKSVGEGYSDNTDNSINLWITKSTKGVYKLALDPANMTNYIVTHLNSTIQGLEKYDVELTPTTHALITVSEEYGEITVTFYNETKLELTLIKQNLLNNKPLEGVEFEITEKDLKTGNIKKLNVEGSESQTVFTNEKGEIYFYLGVAPQNKDYEYTFKEIAIPEKYYPELFAEKKITPPEETEGAETEVTGPQYEIELIETKITVHFDEYGKISSIKTEDSSKTQAFIDGGDNSRSLGVIIKNGNIPVTVPEAPNNLKVEKVWYDDNNKNQTRPDQIEIQLMKNGVPEGNPVAMVDNSTSDNPNTWTYTYKNLPKVDGDGNPIVYTVDEINVPTGYTKTISGDMNSKIVISNALPGEPDEIRDIEVLKIWNDLDNKEQKRPNSVEIQLMKDGVPEGNPVTIDSSKQAGDISIWKHTYTDLPKCDENGRQYIYTVVETSTDENYAVRYSGNMDNRIIITNTIVEPEPEEEIPYRIKVVTEDADTGKRINGSVVDVEVTGAIGNTLTELPRQTQLNENIPDNETANLSTDGKFYTDQQITAGRLRIVEKGIIQTDYIDQTGIINIKVSQGRFIKGYAPGSQKTQGTIELHVQMVQNGTGKDLKITPINTDGLEVTINEKSKEITITIKNESNVLLNIEKLSTVVNEDGTRNAIQGATFTVTSEIVTSAGTTKTDLNVTTRETGVDGITSESVGKAYTGKTVIYTIHENPKEGYKPIEDIVIAVVYDYKEKISYVELLSAYTDVLDWTKTAEELVGQRDISIKVLNEPVVEDYRVIIEKHHLDEYFADLIPGVEYEITVEEQFGETRTWVATTNSEGKIYSRSFTGYGTINIYITEKIAPNGYQLDNQTLHVMVTRNKDTGRIEKYTTDVNYEISKDNKDIILKPVNKFADNTYNIVLDKIDVDTDKRITEDTAEFEVTISKVEVEEVVEEPTNPTEPEDTSELTEQTEATTQPSTTTQEVVTYMKQLPTLTTDLTGRAMLKTIQMPEEEGEYIFTIKETKVPEGYAKDPEAIVFKVTFEKNDNNVMVIKNVEKISGKYAKLSIKLDQTIAFNIGNKDENFVPAEDEYILNINKVDEEGEKIKDIAIFKIIDASGNIEYLETNQLGETFKNLKFPSEPKQEIITIQEIMAPNGYIINREPIKITMNFVKDSNGKIVLGAANMSIKAPGKNVSSAKLEDGVIKLNVVNEEGTLSNDVDRGRYNIILTKIDADTKEIIPKETEIEVVLENGQRVISRTKEDGKINILEIKAPAKAGEYEYVIMETMAPEGYALNADSHIFKITFEEDPNDPTQLVITDAVEVINGTTVSIIHVTDYMNNTVEIQVENRKDNDPLYLKSKLDDEDEVIYNVYNASKQEPIKLPKGNDKPTILSKSYLIDEPVIKTRKLLQKYSATYKGISITEFIENLDTNADTIIVYDTKGNIVTPKNSKDKDNYIGTGYKLKATKGTQELIYTVVIMGDVNGDTRFNSGDYGLSKKVNPKAQDALDEFNNLTLYQKMALDVDENGRVEAGDYGQFKMLNFQ